MKEHEQQITRQTWRDRIATVEEAFFVGREMETALFRDYVLSDHSDTPIINLYGTGGVGKSSLLRQYKVIAKQHGIPFLLLDSRDFTHSPSGFAQRLLDELGMEEIQSVHPVKRAIQTLDALSDRTRLVLAIDTYEELDDLDYWIREFFLPNLNDRFILVLAGRSRLQADWTESPAWRQLIRFLPLSPFDQQTSQAYVSHFDPERTPYQIAQLHRLAHGHPLTLSLFMRVFLGKSEIKFRAAQSVDVLDQLLKRWLREIRHTNLHDLLEAASMVRVFNHEELEAMLNKPIDATDFERLIGLSFIHRSGRGWFVHDGLRPLISHNFKLRKPHLYQQTWQRCISWLYRNIPEQASRDETALVVVDLMYALGDTSLRATFLHGTEGRHQIFETVVRENLGDVKEYLQTVLRAENEYHEFTDETTGTQHVLFVPREFKMRALALFDLEELLDLDVSCLRVLRNEEGAIVIFLVMIPIHEGTLPYLERKPISRHFFRTLTKEQRDAYRVPASEPAGWFQLHIDMHNATTPSRQAFFQFTMSHLLQGRTHLISSPIPYYQRVVMSLGYQEVPGATHTDYGLEYPSPTYKLDLRGVNLKDYVKQFVESAGISLEPSLPEGIFNLTPREREIAQATLTCSTIAEIAAKMHVTEITVKKHLGRIYQKAEVSGKTDLVKKLMSL